MHHFSTCRHLSLLIKTCPSRSNEAIIEDIRHGNSESFGAEPVRELLKLLPETEEVRFAHRQMFESRSEEHKHESAAPHR